MADIVIAPYNDVHCYVWCEPHVEAELSDFLSFQPPNAEFMKRRNKRLRNWDGTVRLYDRRLKMTYVGLIRKIKRWAKRRDLTVDQRFDYRNLDWSYEKTDRLLARYPLPPGMEVRDYQRIGISVAMREQRCVLLSPTGSGKSALLYYLVRAFHDRPVLLIVPTIALVDQMVEDWRGYGWADVDEHVHRIKAGLPKDSAKRVVVSTWQSIFRQPEEFFARFGVVLGDEVHTFRADSLKQLMERCLRVPVRIGVTGTLDDAKANKLSIEGLFGPPQRIARTSDLQALGQLSPIQIQTHVLSYPTLDRNMVSVQRREYSEELDFIVQHPERLLWLVDFVGRLPGNVLVLVQLVEKHGQPLFDALSKRYGATCPVTFIHGKTPAEERESLRALTEQRKRSIIVASYGVFSTGTNIKRLHCVVLASPSKSRYRVLQSIGRGLRLHASKKVVYVMDLVDDLRTMQHVNLAYKHWLVRESFYREESFPVALYTHSIDSCKEGT